MIKKKTPNPTNADKPWVSNYPPLQAWLQDIGARCQDQIAIGDPDYPVGYLEKWITPKGRVFVVEVRSNRLGWNVYTDAKGNSIEGTLTDASSRLDIVRPG